jgi:hypothetical protein
MGYTHYWRHNEDFSKADWAKIRKHAESIIGKSSVPLADWHGTKGTVPEVNDNQISLNGVDDDSHESFVITRLRRTAMAYELEGDADFTEGMFDFCKTARKPYDSVVVSILLYLNSFDNITVTSDGDDFDE